MYFFEAWIWIVLWLGIVGAQEWKCDDDECTGSGTDEYYVFEYYISGTFEGGGDSDCAAWWTCRFYSNFYSDQYTAIIKNNPNLTRTIQKHINNLIYPLFHPPLHNNPNLYQLRHNHPTHLYRSKTNINNPFLHQSINNSLPDRDCTIKTVGINTKHVELYNQPSSDTRKRHASTSTSSPCDNGISSTLPNSEYHNHHPITNSPPNNIHHLTNPRTLTLPKPHPHNNNNIRPPHAIQHPLYRPHNRTLHDPSA
ncbi:hypothetical protein M7I_1516 [Glarea lozoyensis 74030]|uniref:Uncharacterized protein n=1 Tax=Glarea lozoyensis (strain ATCC 74030 / MF5533) TaxID=1104152 RepID=H0EGA4_GLAL7|nr:hypothetical protein M7I_1516 [Glarea lozoyensis 74030]